LAKIYKLGSVHNCIAMLAVDIAAVRERHCAAAVSLRRRRLCSIR